jgi:hypothetical protein
VKQVTSRQQNPIAWPQSARKGFGHLVSSKDPRFKNPCFAPA